MSVVSWEIDLEMERKTWSSSQPDSHATKTFNYIVGHSFTARTNQVHARDGKEGGYVIASYNE